MRQLRPTAANFRAEIARHQLKRTDLVRFSKIPTATLSAYLKENKEMREYAANNLAHAINTLVRGPLFQVILKKGIVPAPVGRPISVRLRYPKAPMNARRRPASVLFPE